MWLPTPIYERVPQFYILVGILFMTDGVYLGFDRVYAFYYIGLGIACSLYGVSLHVVRKRFRQVGSSADVADQPRTDGAAERATMSGETTA